MQDDNIMGVCMAALWSIKLWLFLLCSLNKLPPVVSARLARWTLTLALSLIICGACMHKYRDMRIMVV